MGGGDVCGASYLAELMGDNGAVDGSVRWTMTDLFCGAGGSTAGAETVPGVRVAFAANHWEAAVRTHAAAHPRTRHLVADLNSVRAAAYPEAATDILWSSPVCKPHSRANSPKRRRREHAGDVARLIEIAGADRANRITPWATLDWVEAHQYRSAIVENVAEIAWRWGSFDTWVRTVCDLGYHPPQLVSVNSAFFGASCHRNRLYVVFTRRDGRLPNLNLTPTATCTRCEWIGAAAQVFRNGRTSGNWGAQYDYRCGACDAVVTPVAGSAADVIDTTREWPTVRSRTRTLADASLERLRVGMRRFGPGATWVVGYFRPGTWRSIDDPLGTITCRDHHFVVRNPTSGRDVRRCRLRYLHSDELAAAMGFDDTYPWPERDTDKRTMVGNAVTPPVAAALVERVTAAF